MSRPPETQSTVTVSPDSTAATGFSAASKKPQWQLVGRHCTVWCCDILRLRSGQPIESTEIIAETAPVHAFLRDGRAGGERCARPSPFPLRAGPSLSPLAGEGWGEGP